MIAQINNCLYSGMCHLDPWMELNDEASKELYDMVMSAKNNLETNEFHKYSGWPLGPESFTIHFVDNELSETNISSFPGFLEWESYEISKDEVYQDGSSFNGHPVVKMIEKRKVIDNKINHYLVNLFAQVVLEE